MAKYQIETEDGHIYEIETEDPGPGMPPKALASVQYIGAHDKPQDQPPLGFRPNEGYTPMSKLGQNILPLLAMGMEAAPELGSAAGTSARVAGGAIKGGIEAVPTAKATVPALSGAGIGEIIAGPKGAAIGAGLGAAPEIVGGVIRGAKAALNPPPEAPTPYQPTRPNPNISKLINRSPSGNPTGRSPLPTRPLKTGKVTGGAAPIQLKPASEIQPVGESALPSNDWRFEEQRDMARLLDKHDIDPSTMDDEHWQIAAPALGKNLGLPNATARAGVINQWNKLRGQ